MSVATIAEHTLLVRPLGPQSVVLDLGANRGLFSAAMVERFGCASHAVEANPAVAAHIPDDPRITVYPVAMSGERGEATFHLSTDPLGSGLVPTEELDYTGTFTVETETLPGLLDRIGVERADVVKADIEGAEIALFAACSDDELRRVDQYTVEFHDFCGMTPEADVVRTIERFRDLGFGVYYKSQRERHFDVLIAQTERLGVSAAEWAWVRTGRHYLTGAGRMLRGAFAGKA